MLMVRALTRLHISVSFELKEGECIALQGPSGVGKSLLLRSIADLDPNEHSNIAVSATYFETGRVTLIKDRSNGLTAEGLGWVMLRLDMHFRAELRRERSR